VRHRYGGGGYIMLPAHSTADFVATLLGVMYSGNTPIPFAADLPADGVEYIRQKSNAVALSEPLTSSDFADAQPVDARSSVVPAVIMFTSGTTGFPKGVIISQDNLTHACRTIADYLDYHRHDSAAVVLPLHYSYALLSQVCCLLSVGGFVRLFANFRNPLKFSQAVAELQLATFCGVPSTYQALTMFHRMSPLSMPSIRVLCSAGAAMDRARYQEIQEIFPGATFFNNYGMTEAAPRISFIRDDDPRFEQPTCGRPMDGVQVKVVDPENHAELPDGQQGVLVVKGPNITSGYLNDPELTKSAFTSDGYLISNDIAYLDQGYIYICGRHDDIFNVAGEKVAPLEVERVLNHLPAVDVSAVCGMADGQRGTVPAAFLKLTGPVTRKELTAALQGKLPAAKIPARYFEVSGFPTTPNGKLRRKALSAEDPDYVIREID
jgi:acyl-coenzyme A synthetase/AMP-(fatty) acid ligase